MQSQVMVEQMEELRRKVSELTVRYTHAPLFSLILLYCT